MGIELLERHCQCARRSGHQAVFPLPSNAMMPVSLEAIDMLMQEIESDFRGPGHKGRHVYGVPFNQPYTDFKELWNTVRDSRVLELGDEKAEYAVKVRVFPYAC